MNKFWLVWNDRGGAPLHKHDSYQSAKNEAKRLARLNPDNDFHVLEHVGTAKKIDVSFYVHEQPLNNQFADEDEIPF